MRRVLVCGGREYNQVDVMYRILDAAHKAKPIGRIISGLASGADSIALMWADERGVPVAKFPADWKSDGRAAGPIRNQRMIDEGKPDLVIAFPGGRGTADMVRRAHKSGIAVVTLNGQNAPNNKDT